MNELERMERTEYGHGFDSVTVLPMIPEHLRPSRVTCHVAMDNYEPFPRFVAFVFGTTYDLADGGRGLRVEHGEGFVPRPYRTDDGPLPADYRRITGYVLLVDTGRAVVPYYSAGCHDGRPSAMHPEGHSPYSLWHPFPTAIDGTFSGWAVGPRKAYHLKVTDGEV